MKFRARAASWIAVAALAVAVPAAQAAKTTSKSKTPAVAQSDILAWVDGKPITRQELESRLDELSPAYRQQFNSTEGRQKLLDGIIEERVWSSAAEKAGVPQRPEVARQIEQAERTLVIRSYLSEVMQGAPAPSDSSVKAFYEAHKDDPQFQTSESRRVRHIQVATEAEAKTVQAKLQKNGDFAALAKQYSKDGATKDSGGEIGRIDRMGAFGSLGRQPAIADSAFSMASGKISGPIKSSIGWHIIQVEEITPPAAVSLDDARPRILSTMGRQMQEDYYKAQLNKAKQGSSFRYNQAVVDSFLNGKKSAPELFREAQDATTTEERIAGYERVISDYPLSEQAPQAQFMVGFVYSEEKKDYDRAEAAFKRLLKDYPKSELAHSAQWMLDNMRTDALPNFDLPGGVKRSGDTGTASAPNTTKK